VIIVRQNQNVLTTFQEIWTENKIGRKIVYRRRLIRKMPLPKKKSCSQRQPVIKCHRLPLFETNTLDSVKAAFQHVVPISAQQKWRKKEEPHFSPMLIRTGWCDNILFLFAELTDTDIFTLATKNSQRFWELGDVFEVFLRPRIQKSYVELQVAPNNKRLQLRYQNARAVIHARKLGTSDHLLIHGRAFLSSTWICAAEQKWYVFVKIPAKTVCEQAILSPGVEWLFSFSRYDYTHDSKRPVISSTSPHKKPDFHRHTEWQVMRFVD
jgi:hypothetical protein